MKYGLWIFGLDLLLATWSMSMHIEWTRMTGQWPVEAAPSVINFDGKGADEILAVNRGGQLLLWDIEGKPVGSGQDGLILQLPEGRWTSTPTVIGSAAESKIVLCSVEGLVVCVDTKYSLLWQYKLPGQTTWGRAMPAVLPAGTGSLLIFGDNSGAVTCLDVNGKLVWSKPLDKGACCVPLQAATLRAGKTTVLAATGSMVSNLDDQGNVLWQTDLGNEISTRAEVVSHADKQVIICGTKTGTLCALAPDGKILWQAEIGDEVNVFLSVLPRKPSPLILCTGLWGCLHTFDVEGHNVWSHLYHSKSRSKPVLFDADADGDLDILVAAYDQHLYAFDTSGKIVDDVRLSGTCNSSPLLVSDPKLKRTDIIVTTGALLTYRIRSGAPESASGAPLEAGKVALVPTMEDFRENQALLVDNPEGSLIRVNLSMTNSLGRSKIVGQVSARTAFEIPLPALADEGTWNLRAIAKDAKGKIVAENRWTIAYPIQAAAPPSPKDQLKAWPTPAYGSFDEERLVSFDDECAKDGRQDIFVKGLYRGEIDQGAFIVASGFDTPIRALLSITNPVRDDGTAFGGKITVRQVIPTGTFNGEQAADALPALGDDRLVMIPSLRAVKLWLSIDTHGAESGTYNGHIMLAPLQPRVDSVRLSFGFEILDLELPKQLPLTLCTWDYVPNQWFNTSAIDALDDMSRHGVNVFPRSSCMPQAKVDGQGEMTIYWQSLNAELERLSGRGMILFQLTHPPMMFATQADEKQKRQKEIEYLHAFRDHLKKQGLNYQDYAFYPVDEPGLDYGKSTVPTLIDAAELFRAADPKFRIYTDPVPGLSGKDFERIDPLIDVWCPNMRLVSGLLSGDPRVQRIVKSGKTVWSYECESQPKSMSPLRYNRANAWRAEFFGLEGIGFWTHSTIQFNIWFKGKTFDDEYAMVYPGAKPVPSVRWEAVRDGLEDIAAVRLLKERMNKHKQAGTKLEVVERATNELRKAKIDILELSDAAFVESRDYLKAGDRKIWHSSTDIKVYERHRAEIARLTEDLAK